MDWKGIPASVLVLLKNSSDTKRPMDHLYTNLQYRSTYTALITVGDHS
jgi:hypothetical protein